jgi:hypothetical protein
VRSHIDTQVEANQVPATVIRQRPESVLNGIATLSDAEPSVKTSTDNVTAMA